MYSSIIFQDGLINYGKKEKNEPMECKGDKCKYYNKYGTNSFYCEIKNGEHGFTSYSLNYPLECHIDNRIEKLEVEANQLASYQVELKEGE